MSNLIPQDLIGLLLPSMNEHGVHRSVALSNGTHRLRYDTMAAISI